MPTVLSPSDVATLKVATYRKALDKDLAKNARSGKFVGCFFVEDYKMDGKKIPLLLFAAKDATWKDTLNEAATKGKKSTEAVCKIVSLGDTDGNGIENIEIKIKSSVGDYNKTKLAEKLKEELFKSDLDIKVSVCGDEEEDDIAKTEVQSEEAIDAVNIKANELKQLQMNTSLQKELKEFQMAIKSLFASIGSPDELQTDIKADLLQLKTEKQAADDKSKVTKMLESAEILSKKIDSDIEAIETCILEGEEWLSEHKKSIGKFLKLEAYTKPYEQAKVVVVQLHRLARFLAQAQEHISGNFLTGDAHSEYQKAKKEQETANNQYTLIQTNYANYKSTHQGAATQTAISTALNELSRLSRGIQGWLHENKSDYQNEDQKEWIAKLQKFVDNEIKAKNKAFKNTLSEAGKNWFVGYEECFEDFSGDTSEELRRKIFKICELDGKLSTRELEEAQIVSIINMQKTAMQKQFSATAKKGLLVELRDRISRRGEIDADKAFDVFMSEFRNRFKYTPEPGGLIFDGAGNGNCQDITNSYKLFLDYLGLKNSEIITVGENFVTSAINEDWIFPAVLGNTKISDRDSRHYYFAEHWAIKVDGKIYCPTSGLQGSNFSAGIWFSGAKHGQKIEGYLFEDLRKVDDPNTAIKANDGYQYKLTKV